jgi:hypothetical protein
MALWRAVENPCPNERGFARAITTQKTIHETSGLGYDDQRTRRAARPNRSHNTSIACRGVSARRPRAMAGRAIRCEDRGQVCIRHSCRRCRRRWCRRRRCRGRRGRSCCVCLTDRVGRAERDAIGTSRQRHCQRRGHGDRERAATGRHDHFVLSGTRRPVDRIPAVKPLSARYRSYCTVSPVP